MTRVVIINMFKKANKQIGQSARVSVRNITTNRMIINDNLIKTKARKQILNVYGQLDGRLGVVQMNREHRYNTLSPNMIQNITRCVDTMDNDHIATTIYLGSAESEHFSNGTDFRTIAHMKKEDNLGRIQEYLQQLYNLQTKIASINKPLIALANGHAMNSGAALLAAAGHPLTTLDTKVAFNEVTFGFVPHSGATYYLSRMPGEFGTFMALTGLPIHGTDAARISLTKGIVHDPVEYSQEISDVVNSLDYPGVSGNDIFKQNDSFRFLTPWQQYLYDRDVIQDQFRVTDAAQLQSEKLVQNEMGDFIPLEERKISSVAEAEYRYKQLLRKDANDKNDEMGYLEFMQGTQDRSNNFLYKNYYADQMNYIKSHITLPYPHDSGFAANHQELIDRCFFGNSVEQIMENLRKEKHPFATECLKQMERNSILSMNIALKMIRKAVNLDYKGTLQMELDVAFNKIQDKDFDIGVHEILMTPKTKGAKTKTANFQKKVNEAELDKYFEPSKWSKGIDLGIVENALLPTKHYYERFSDQVRLWLNETTTTQGKIREQFDKEAKEALKEHGIDVRDKALNPKIARNHIAAKLAQENYTKVFNQRAEQLMIDTKLRENYFKQIQEQLSQIESDQTLFYKQVNKHISSIFQDAFLNRLDTIQRKSKQVQSLEKRRMFVQLKKFLFKSRILSYGNEEIERSIKQIQALPFQQIHLTEKWDTSFREGQHPDLVHTPLYYLSKVIGRVSLTTPELAKAYLSNAENRQQMTMFALDQNELEKLQIDVLSNPEKYEQLLTNYQTETADSKLSTKMDRGLARAKQDEQEYWFRVMNDGMCPLDSFPYAKEFSAYKEWADRIENNAVNTLRMCIDKLLLESQAEKKVFDGKLKNLVRIVNQQKDKKANVAASESAHMLGSKMRSVSDLKNTLKVVLQEELGFNFDNDSAKSKALREDFENELLSLVEIVLLNKYGYNNPKEREVFEKRLAELTNPEGLPSQQLNVIDHYLSRKNGEALVKDAINLVLPYFSQVIQTKLQEEAKKILSKFKVQDTQPQVLLFYFFNKSLTEQAKTGIYQKYLNYSFEQDVNQRLLGAVPFASKQFQKRELLASMGMLSVDSKLSVGEKQYASLSQTQKDLNDLSNFEANAQKQSFKISSDAERDQHMNLSQQEIRDLEAIETRLLDVYEWLHDNKYEIDHHLTEIDYLHLYSEAILNQGFNMSGVAESGDDHTWTDLAKYAQFVNQLSKQVQKVASSQNFDAIGFIQNQKAKDSKHELLYSSIANERSRLKNSYNTKNSFNRHSVIQGQLDDYNRLQQQINSSNILKQDIAKLASQKSPEVREKVQDYLENSAFIDLETLHQSLQAKDLKFLSEPSSIIDAPKLIRASKGFNKIMDQKVDVLSINQLQNVIENDESIDEAHKKQINLLLNYINDQTKYIPNADRKNISVGDYINKYSCASTESFSFLKSSLLQGQQETAIIDWQVGSSRTHPSEHINPPNVEQVLSSAENPQANKQIHVVHSRNPTTGQIEVDSLRDFEQKQVLRLAKELTDLPTTMTPTKNMYENKLLQKFLEVEVDDSQINQIIEEYTQLRIKSCLLNSDFAKQIKTENAHIFFKVLREKVIDELGLSKPPQITDMAHNTITDKANISLTHDLESPYNLQNLNNQDALGYDNLINRAKAETAQENFELAHETVFEKLLADYFLGKRGEYKESNALLKNLNEIFENPKFSNPNFSPMENLRLAKLTQEVNKTADGLIAHENFRNLIELDVAASRAIQSNKNGLSTSLRQIGIDETDHADYFKTQIPEYYDVFDVRKPAEKYVEDKLRCLIQESFDVRAQLEKNMTRRELLAFDKVLAKYLSHRNLMPRLRDAVSQDYSQLQQGRSLVQQNQENQKNIEAQEMKFENKQRALNKSTVNEDAEFKLLAFNAANERKNQQLIDTKDGLDLLYNTDSFAEWYKQELMSEAKRQPRQIDPSAFEPKKPWEYPQGEFQNAKQRQESFYKDHQIYLEKKKEQQDRIQLFYIFEQFYETARQKPDPVSKAQQHLREYFAEPENTFFFDKNKIV